MKVKELVKYLKGCNQEAVICFDEYIGSNTPTLEVKTAELYQKGRYINEDISSLINREGKAKLDLIKLSTY